MPLFFPLLSLSPLPNLCPPPLSHTQATQYAHSSTHLNLPNTRNSSSALYFHSLALPGAKKKQTQAAKIHFVLPPNPAKSHSTPFPLFLSRGHQICLKNIFCRLLCAQDTCGRLSPISYFKRSEPDCDRPNPSFLLFALPFIFHVLTPFFDWMTPSFLPLPCLLSNLHPHHAQPPRKGKKKSKCKCTRSRVRSNPSLSGDLGPASLKSAGGDSTDSMMSRLMNFPLVSCWLIGRSTSIEKGPRKRGKQTKNGLFLASP